MQNFNRELESVRNNHQEIQEQKNTTTEVKNSKDGFTDNWVPEERICGLEDKLVENTQNTFPYRDLKS